jgi:hypothetical protein
MALPSTQQTREYNKFVECPVDSGQPAVRTKICQDENESIKVEIGVSGVEIVEFQEIFGVAGLATETILNYTVAAGKILTLVMCDVSGDNRGIYRVEKNGSTIGKKRTYYTNYDNSFSFASIKLVAGDNLKVIVENQSTLNGDFNANIQGSLRDA